jgi:NADPH:quinone reductase-like Zn-dependent oxidoreductase
MKAIVQNSYGTPDALEIKDIDKPAMKDNSVLIRVHATSVNAGDYFSLKGSPWLVRMSAGFPKPKDYVLGWDVAGRIEAVGKNVTRFQPGDEVFGACSHAFAEYVSADAGMFAAKPANLTFEQAAAVPTAALTALQALRDKGKLEQGMKVLINGASGGVGTFAVQIAKSFGAEVTGVCSMPKVELVQALGADHVIDYTREDFAQSEKRFDLLLDNVGNRTFADLRRALAPQGIIVPNSGHGGMGYVFKAYFLSYFTRWQGRPFLASINNKDLVVLKELIESGKITPVIDRTYSLNKIKEAFRYLDEHHAKGKVVISVMRHNTI